MSDEQARDGRHIVVAGLWTLTSNAVPLLLTAALSVVMGRVLGPDLLGQQSLIAYVDATLATLLIGSVTQTAIRSLAVVAGAGDQDARARLDRWSTYSAVVAGLVSGAAMTAFGLLSDDPAPWLIAGLCSLINGLGWSYGVRLISREGWSRVAARRLLWQSLAQAMGIVAVLMGFGVDGVFWANAIAAFGLLLMLRRLSGGLVRGAMRPLPRDVVRLWMMFVLVELLTQVVSKRIEFVFLGTLSTTDQVAMYSVAFVIVSSAALLPASFFQAAMPSVAASHGAGRAHEATQVLGRVLRVILVLSLPLTAGIVMFGPPLILALYGPEFAEAAGLVRLLAISTVILPAAELTAVYWIGAGRVRHVLVANAWGGLVDIGLAATLVGPYGALGAAVANTVGQLLAGGLLVRHAWRSAQPERGPGLRWPGAALAAMAAVGLALTLAWQMPGWAGLLAGALAGTVLLIGFGLLVGYVDSDDGRWLADMVPGALRPAVGVIAGRGGRATRRGDEAPPPDEGTML